MRLQPGRGVVVLVMLLVACQAAPSPTPSAPVETPSAAPTPTATSTTGPAATDEATPAATPEPPLSLELPDETDERVVAVSVEPAVDDRSFVVTVTSAAEERVDELVLRWDTELSEVLFLAPFEPTPERIREGGPPLVQPWTKWVIGPGEQGEPAGTTSVGWGPLMAGGTLEIPLVAERRAEGPIAFDLQILAGNAILTLEGGEPAELRVEVP